MHSDELDEAADSVIYIEIKINTKVVGYEYTKRHILIVIYVFLVSV